MLDEIKIASRCSADWEQMEGTDRVRFCSECKKNVFNLSAMTRRGAEALLKQTNGNICARLYRRADGTVLTEDCPIGLRVKIARVRRRLGWALAGAFGLSTAWAQDSAVVSGSVRNSDGTFAARASVLIKGDLFRAETITDDHGTFGATELAAGKYVITVAGWPAREIEVKPGHAIEFVFQQVAMQDQFMGEISNFKRKPWWRRLLSSTKERSC
jgi:hypothetical protein